MAQFEWLKGFDRDPAYVNVNYRGRKIHQSRTGGLISLIFLVSVFIILFFKISFMMKQSRVIFETRIGKDSFDMINLSDANLTLSILDSNHDVISCKDIEQYGVTVIVSNRQYDEQGRLLSTEEEQLTPKVNSTTQFDIKNYHMLNIKGRPDVISPKNDPNSSESIYQQFSIQIKPIKVTQRAIQNPVRLSIYPLLRFTNHVINQQMKEMQEAIAKNQHRMFKTAQPLIVGQSTVQYTFQMKKVTMKTDYSILPSFLKQYFHSEYESVDSWFYGQEFTTETYIRDQESLYQAVFIAYFIRSMYTNTYIRHFDKLDIVMAESFGLIGLLSILLFCLYKGYNNWVLERENIGEQKQINILDYYKYQIRSFCYFAADNLKRFLLFFKCYSCLKRIKKNICCCLFRKTVKEELIINQKKKHRLEDELDLFKSRRQINYLRRKFQVLADVLCEKFPELKIKLDQQIQLPHHYEITQSFLCESKELQSQLKKQSVMSQKLLQSDQNQY